MDRSTNLKGKHLQLVLLEDLVHQHLLQLNHHLRNSHLEDQLHLRGGAARRVDTAHDDEEDAATRDEYADSPGGVPAFLHLPADRWPAPANAARPSSAAAGRQAPAMLSTLTLSSVGRPARGDPSPSAASLPDRLPFSRAPFAHCGSRPFPAMYQNYNSTANYLYGDGERLL